MSVTHFDLAYDPDETNAKAFGENALKKVTFLCENSGRETSGGVPGNFFNIKSPKTVAIFGLFIEANEKVLRLLLR